MKLCFTHRFKGMWMRLGTWDLRVYHQNEWTFLEGFYWTAKAEAKQMVTAYGYGTLGCVFYNNVARIKVFYREKATLIHAIFRSSTPYGQSNRVPTSCCVIQAVNTGRKRLIFLIPLSNLLFCLIIKHMIKERPNFSTKSIQKSEDFPPCYSQSPTALPWDFLFFQTHATSCVKLLYTVKEKGGKPDRKPYPLPYSLRNPYRNLKSEKS